MVGAGTSGAAWHHIAPRQMLLSPRLGGVFGTGGGCERDLHILEGSTGNTAPRNVSELRSTLGMINYYRQYIPNLSIHTTTCSAQGQSAMALVGCMRVSIPSSKVSVDDGTGPCTLQPRPTTGSGSRCPSVWIGGSAVSHLF